MQYKTHGHRPRRFIPRHNKRPQKSFSDISKFVNKAVITEEVVHFVPEHTFKSFKLDKTLQANIEKKGYTSLTPIQDRSIPHIMRGEDIVGIANTGTGKTAAFLIPLVNKIILDPREKVLIVVPTRELAAQIEDELKTFAKGSGLFSVTCVGGTSMGRQISDLRHTHHFVIGTPGRLKDLIEQKKLDLSGFKTVVLDEADRMLDMGFIADMRFMMAKMPSARHTLFFSATLSPEIEKLIHEFLKEPVRISVKTQDTSKNVHQDVIRVAPGKTKIDTLQDLLLQSEFKKVLVFGRTKYGVEKLARELNKRGFKTESIHGNKSQPQRQNALNHFKHDRAQVLTATDVAARGLDISDITHVINFYLPATYDDYVHRIGRTGRGESKGKALTFVE
jgi:ATP-dependent RNA helicase RhlE